MPLFRGSKNATIVNGEIVATQSDIVEALRDINIVATNVDGENTIGIVASIDDEVVTLANISGEITSLESIKDDIVITADNVTKVTNFADVYLGASDSNPTTRTDGSALQEGDVYFNTSLNEFRAFTGFEFLAFPPDTTNNIFIERFSGDGAQTDFNLSINPTNKDFVQIYIDGVYQQKNTFSLSNSIITFSEAPPLGTENIEIVILYSVDIGATDANLVSVEDVGSYYSSDQVEEVLQEVGASLDTKVTETEARNSLSAAGDLSYNSTTGEFSVTTYKSSDFDTDFSNKDTDDLSEGSTNLYYTDARVDSHLSGGTGVSYSSGTISIGQSVGTTDNVTFNDVTISGDLTVTGTTTSLNTTTLDVEDINITVANGATGASAANGAGLTADLGPDGTATFTYDSANDRWTMNKTLDTNLVGDVTGTVSDISNHDTDDLPEGTTNLYYTDIRTRNALSASGDLSYSSSTGEFSVTTYKTSDFDADFSSKDTDDLSEGAGNLYYTDARARGALSASGDLSYDSSTGVFSFTETPNYTDSDALDLFNATGSAPVYACRAWVNFDGTGTVSIRDSGNVSSITDNETGDYTVNFTTAMPDSNYSVSGSVSWDGATWGNTFMLDAAVYSTTAVKFVSQHNSATLTSSFEKNDALIACVQVFR